MTILFKLVTLASRQTHTFVLGHAIEISHARKALKTNVNNPRYGSIVVSIPACHAGDRVRFPAGEQHAF